MDRAKVIRLVDDYMEALKTGDYSAVKLSSDVSVIVPLVDSPINGKASVLEFLLEVSDEVEDVRVQQYVIDGSTACVLIEYETVKGDVLPILDYLQFDGEGISHIQPFFDPRPLIED
jgi:hypothetical protein